MLFSTPNHEGPWICPIVRSLRRIGAPYATSETYGWDSRRFAMYLRRLPVKAIIGIGAETVRALAALGGDLVLADDRSRGRVGTAGRRLAPPGAADRGRDVRPARPRPRPRPPGRARSSGERRRVDGVRASVAASTCRTGDPARPTSTRPTPGSPARSTPGARIIWSSRADSSAVRCPSARGAARSRAPVRRTGGRTTVPGGRASRPRRPLRPRPPPTSCRVAPATAVKVSEQAM